MEMIQEEKTQQEIEKLLEEKQYTRLRQRVAELNDADIGMHDGGDGGERSAEDVSHTAEKHGC